jgi:HAD superfamily hydrolase (TIGR01484 family)
MSSRYDLLVVDLDGTLLDRRGRVSHANREALDDARTAGMELIIATGRALVESQAAISEVNHDGLVVAAGGSLLCEATTGATVVRHAIAHEVVIKVTEALLGDGHKSLILKDAHVTEYDYLAVGPGELDPASKWWFDHLPVKVKFIEDLAHDPHPHDTVRAGAVASQSRLAPLAKRLREELRDSCCLQHWSAVTSTEAIGSITHLLEVFNPQVNKWTMIERLCSDRGIPTSRVAALGDGVNDLELLRGAGLGVAMGNSSPEVAAVADHTSCDHESDGVAHAVRQILSGAW